MNKIKESLYRKLPINIKMFYKLGYYPSLKNPKTFNEKIGNRIIKGGCKDYSNYSDKILVREIISNELGNILLVPFVEKINISELYEKTYDYDVIIKANHNSGPVYILRANEKLTYKKISCLRKQLDTDYGKINGEKWYSEIKRQIFVEKLLNIDGKIPNDYKFHVFNYGEEVILQIDYDRMSDHSRTFYDVEGNIKEYSLLYQNKYKPFTRPKCFDDMLMFARKMGEKFDYVRVDLYDMKDKAYFGELTFAHGAGLERFSPRRIDLMWGEKWK